MAIFLIAASFAMATVTLAPAFADKRSADPGLENADNKIHEHAGIPPAKLMMAFIKEYVLEYLTQGVTGKCP